MSSKFLFFLIGGSMHHLYHLQPYIEATPEKEYVHLYTEPTHNDLLEQYFPDLKLKAIECYASERVSHFCKFKYIITSNMYQFFDDNIKPKLDDDTVITYVNHGSLQKLAEVQLYVFTTLLYDTSVVCGRKDLDIYRHYKFIPPPDGEHYQNIFDYERDGSVRRIIQGGNLRVRSFQQNPPEKADIIDQLSTFDPSRKTILYMPTYSESLTDKKLKFCSISFFVDLLKHIKEPESYNFIIKLHPNLVYNRDLLGKLDNAVRYYKLNAHLDMFSGDYLKYMSVADIMLSDRTASAFDFLYFNKPIIFLDELNKCKQVPAFDDVINSFWLYQAGDIIAPRNIEQTQEIIDNNLAEDRFQEIRKNCKEYAFDDSLPVEHILKAIEYHPKQLLS